MQFLSNIISLSLALVLAVHFSEQAIAGKQSIIGNWGYRNDSDAVANILPNNWDQLSPKCAGYRQSPIDINFGLSQYDSALPLIKLDRYTTSESPETWTISNNQNTGSPALL